jgi:alanyl-tRNA synthetase
MFCLNQISNSADIKAKRIIADHIRTATFMIADGVKPSNVDRGYVLRRLIRRARYYLDSIGARDKKLASVNINIPKIYKSTDYDLDSKIIEIETVITDEEMEFSATLAFGKKLLEKVIKMHGKISGEDAFMLYSTYGYPFELIKEIAKENNIQVDEVNFTERKEQHRKISRAGAEQKFKGGLANTNEKTVRLHTAHHLLLAALQEKFGKGVKQKGSNINEERLRMDFSFDRKLTPEELKEIEDRVNNWIREDLSVEKKEMEREEAEKMGAEMEFGTKYPKTVSVYFIQDDKENAISREFCGGPHTKSTGQLGKFKIRKEEATSSGVRRIKATLE